MAATTSYFDKMQSVIQGTRADLERLETMAKEYAAILNREMETNFFSSPTPEQQKKIISNAYFQFCIQIKDTLSSIDLHAHRLTIIMRQADLDFWGKMIELGDTILYQHLKFEESVRNFSTHSEDLISHSSLLPLKELSMELRRLVLRIQETCAQMDEAQEDLLKIYS